VTITIKNKKLTQLLNIVSARCGPDVPLKCLDCRKLGGDVDSLFDVMSKFCQSILSKNIRNLGVDYMTYGFYCLLEESEQNVLSLSDIVNSPLRDDYILSKNKTKIIEVLSLLHSTGLICLLQSSVDTSKVWVVVHKQILLAEVDGILFAPKYFKEYQANVASNTGIITSSSLIQLFPHYDPEMLICFLTNMALCQEIDSSLLTVTNLEALNEEDKLLFFPALLNIDRPHNNTG
jgi:hypothetical protein